MGIIISIVLTTISRAPGLYVGADFAIHVLGGLRNKTKIRGDVCSDVGQGDDLELELALIWRDLFQEHTTASSVNLLSSRPTLGQVRPLLFAPFDLPQLKIYSSVLARSP